MANKVKYGLKNVHYSVITETGGNITYGTPVAWPGAVSLSLSPVGEQNPFYADNGVYFSTVYNGGYEGDFESALIPDSFRVACLGEVLDTAGFYLESSSAVQSEFALLFQFEGDESATRHVLYRCKAARPEVAGSTTEDTVEPQTETITITAMPRLADGAVKSRCPASATTPYNAWFTAVQEPTVTP